MMISPYWDPQLMLEDNQKPHILAIGDSWFWYPLNNLLNPIFKHFNGGKCILVLGNNGAEVVEYVGGKYRDGIQETLEAWPDHIEAVLISGGGNDFAGLDDMFRIIKTQCAGFATVDECFKAHQPRQIFDEVGDAYRRLIDIVFAAVPKAKIFLHNYDRAVPTGKGFAGLGNWLRAPMVQARVGVPLHQAIVNRLLFEFTQRLKTQAARSSQIFFVDSARLGGVARPEDIQGKGTLTGTEWANELHPKPRGFNKIVKACWAPAFAAAGLAP